MDEGARVVTAENQRLTGHTGALLCLALLDSRLLFSSSTDLTIKARLNVPLGLFVIVTTCVLSSTLGSSATSPTHHSNIC